LSDPKTPARSFRRRSLIKTRTVSSMLFALNSSRSRSSSESVFLEIFTVVSDAAKANQYTTLPVDLFIPLVLQKQPQESNSEGQDKKGANVVAYDPEAPNVKKLLPKHHPLRRPHTQPSKTWTVPS